MMFAEDGTRGWRDLEVRVVEHPDGEWRVEDLDGGRAACASRADAERYGEYLLCRSGGGLLFVLDRHRRVLATKRVSSASSSSD